jgi:hypothetical protein
MDFESKNDHSWSSGDTTTLLQAVMRDTITWSESGKNREVGMSSFCWKEGTTSNAKMHPSNSSRGQSRSYRVLQSVKQQNALVSLLVNASILFRLAASKKFKVDPVSGLARMIDSRKQWFAHHRGRTSRFQPMHSLSARPILNFCYKSCAARQQS